MEAATSWVSCAPMSAEPNQDRAQEAAEWLKGKGKEALQKADEVADKVQSIADPVVENVKEATAPVIEKAKGVFGELVDSFKDMVKEDGTADTRSAIDKIRDALTKDSKPDEQKPS